MIRPDKAAARSGPPDKVIYLTCVEMAAYCYNISHAASGAYCVIATIVFSI